MPIVPESVWNTIITGVLLLASFFIQRWFAQRDKAADTKAEAERRALETKHETDRWYAEFFMRSMIDAITNQQIALQRLINTLTTPDTESLDSALDAAHTELLAAYMRCATYLDAESRDVIGRCLEMLMQLLGLVRDLEKPDSNTPVDEAQLEQIRKRIFTLAESLARSATTATLRLSNQMNPAALRRFVEQTTQKPSTHSEPSSRGG